MGKRFLIDTNVVVDFLTGQLPASGMHSVSKIINLTPVISVITKIELLSYKGNKTYIRVVEDFCKNADIINLDESIILSTIKLRQKYKIKLPDAIIAASAMSNNMILTTHNVNDFKNIYSLKLIDPYKM